MKIHPPAAIVLLVALAGVLPPGSGWSGCRRARGSEEADLKPLFNGKNLDGWVAEGAKTYREGDEERPVWTVGEDGLVHCAGRGYGFLRYDTKVCDFVFHVEYRMSKGCNSGIGIRSVKFTGPARTRPSFAGYEIQVLDDAGKSPNTHCTGSLYRYVAPTSLPVKPAPEWNAMTIECVGPRIKITLNGEVIHDIDQTEHDKIKNKPLCGYVSLQNHGRKIAFRNVSMKVLKAAPEASEAGE